MCPLPLRYDYTTCSSLRLDGSFCGREAVRGSDLCRGHAKAAEYGLSLAWFEKYDFRKKVASSAQCRMIDATINRPRPGDEEKARLGRDAWIAVQAFHTESYSRLRMNQGEVVFMKLVMDGKWDKDQQTEATENAHAK